MGGTTTGVDERGWARGRRKGERTGVYGRKGRNDMKNERTTFKKNVGGKVIGEE